MSKYGNSSFLRTSAVYGSSQPTVFSEPSAPNRKIIVDRSAVGGVSSFDPLPTRRGGAGGASSTNSPYRNTNSPMRHTTMETETNSRNYGNFDSPARAPPQTGKSHPSVLFQGAGPSSPYHTNNSHNQRSGGDLNTPTRTGSGRGDSPSRQLRAAPPNNASGNNNYHHHAQQQTPSSTPRTQAPPNQRMVQQYSNNNANATNSRQQSPVGSRRGTPERARSPNPITGEYPSYGGGDGNSQQRGNYGQQYHQQQQTPSNARSSYSAVRFGNGSNVNNTNGSTRGGNAAKTNNNSYYYIGDNTGNSGTASRTSSIGRSSSVDSYNNGRRGGSQGGQHNNNQQSAAGISSAEYARRNSGGLMSLGGVQRVSSGKGRAITPPRRAESPLAHSGEYQQGSNANNASIRTTNSNVNMRAAGVIERSFSGVRRTPQSQYGQGSFHISQCGPAANDSSTTSRARSGSALRGSQPRVDPTTMSVPAGVRTPRERFDESPFKIPQKKIVREAFDKNVSGVDCGDCIFRAGYESGNASPGARTTTVVNADGSVSEVPLTLQTTERPQRRHIDPPQKEQKIGLWVRTRNKDDVVHLGIKGRGLPPPDNKVDDTFPSIRKVIPQPANIEAAACRVVGEEQTRIRAKFNPIPNKPYHGFVVPPFRVDVDEVRRVAPDLEPETYMEPFGTEYTHRRHFDPVDSVKEDIMHCAGNETIGEGLDSTSTLNTHTNIAKQRRGTAMVEGKGPNESPRNILTLQNYTAEELGEPQLRNVYRAGPPAFVPEEVKPFRANVSYKPHISGCYNSPNHDSSGIGFGTSLNTHRAQNSPIRTSSPRGPKFGTYSPARNTGRPF